MITAKCKCASRANAQISDHDESANTRLRRKRRYAFPSPLPPHYTRPHRRMEPPLELATRNTITYLTTGPGVMSSINEIETAATTGAVPPRRRTVSPDMPGDDAGYFRALPAYRVFLCMVCGACYVWGEL
jgi:hypothetical protein